MPKPLWAERLTEAQYNKLLIERPYITGIEKSKYVIDPSVIAKRLHDQVNVPITPEESIAINIMLDNLKRIQFNAAGTFKKYSYGNSGEFTRHWNRMSGAVIPGVDMRNARPPFDVFFGDPSVKIHDIGGRWTTSFPLRYVPEKLTKDLASEISKTAVYSGHRNTANPVGSNNDRLRPYQVHAFVRAKQIWDDINAGVKKVKERQEIIAIAQKQAEIKLREYIEAEKLKSQNQEAAAKASYEDALKFKTEEFNRALAAQKEEHGRKSQEYESRLAQFSANFERQTKELSGVRLELAKQKTDYENQIAARKLEESKRKQEAEVLQSNLKRRIAIYEAGRGANLHFVGLNGGDGQSRGARVLANSGGRYVKSRVSYNPGGAMRFNNSSEDLNVPDLFLDALSPSNRRRERR